MPRQAGSDGTAQAAIRVGEDGGQPRPSAESLHERIHLGGEVVGVGQLHDCDGSLPQVGEVVGAAIVWAGRVLAARRTAPVQAAGRWELPGGKVEPGETPSAALVREIAEELGCGVAVDHWLPGSTRISTRLTLRIAVCSLVSGEPAPTEHDAIRWLRVAELDDVDWLDSDRPFLAPIAAHLRALDS